MFFNVYKVYKVAHLETNLSQYIVPTTSDLSNIKIPLNLFLMQKILYELNIRMVLVLALVYRN